MLFVAICPRETNAAAYGSQDTWILVCGDGLKGVPLSHTLFCVAEDSKQDICTYKCRKAALGQDSRTRRLSALRGFLPPNPWDVQSTGIAGMILYNLCLPFSATHVQTMIYKTERRFS